MYCVSGFDEATAADSADGDHGGGDNVDGDDDGGGCFSTEPRLKQDSQLIMFSFY
jgi:hypothetical protein